MNIDAKFSMKYLEDKFNNTLKKIQGEADFIWPGSGGTSF